MWSVSGIDYSTLIDKLIELGIEEFNHRSNIKYSFKELGEEYVGKKEYH